jgi:hypothetical protein
MKNIELYHKTVDILVKAYVNNTLRTQQCVACAVGNIIAGNCGYAIPEDTSVGIFEYWVSGDGKEIGPAWQKVFCTNLGYQGKNPDKYEKEAKEQIDSTGYSWEDLAKIEYAFECNHKGDDPMYSSLMAVIDVLDKLHEVTEEASNSSKLKFATV